MSELIAICVPGYRLLPDGNAGLSLVIVPRLTGPGATLATHGMDNWPDRLRACRFHAMLLSEDIAVRSVEIQPIFAASAVDMLAGWRALFVEPGIVRLGAAGTVEPEVAAPVTAAEPPQIDIVETGAEASGVLAAYTSALSGGDWSAELAAVAELSHRRSRLDERTERRRRVAPAAAPTDFHRRVAMLREHPLVQRAVGLIVDFTLAIDEAEHAVRMDISLPPWPTSPAPFVSAPWTRFQREGDRLVIAPRHPDRLRHGLVDLGGAGLVGSSTNPDWAVVTFDVDSAMQRLSGVISRRRSGATDDAVLPRLRTAGLGLVRTGRAEELHERLRHSATRGRSADDADLFAEDLTLGYRLDVSADGSGWRSLMERIAQYSIAGKQLGPPTGVVEEGHVKRDTLLVDRATGALTGDELIAKWDGWSLAAPKPQPSAVDTPPAVSPTELTWTFSPEPPLPRLRFGHTYRLRARVADLAGGGPTVADLAAGDGSSRTAAMVSDGIDYLRAEPVPPPVVTLPPDDMLTPGAAVDRLVVRSPGGPPPPTPEPDGTGEPVDPLLIPDPFGDLLKADETAQPASEPQAAAAPAVAALNSSDRRLLNAPAVSLELADQHGMFDGIEPEVSWPIARRAIPALDGGSPLPDPTASSWVVTSAQTPLMRSAWKRLAGGSAQDLAAAGFELRAALAVGAAIADDGDGVVVTLPPGAKLDVQIASGPDAAAGALLGLPVWTATAGDTSTVVDVGDGRHPHLTPARTVRLVHAVQKPLTPPTTFYGIRRQAAATAATVFVTGFRAHLGTTGHIEIGATWQEWGDSPRPIGSRSAHVGTVVTPADGQWSTQTFTHEFGDTRRRRVAYTPVAVSSFQEYFDPAIVAADPAAFAVRGDSSGVDVPSSARPADPVVVDAVPAVVWDGDGGASPGWQRWTHTRGGGRVRLRLHSGWFSSGEGEVLGLVVTNDPFPPARLWPYLSQAGRDPVRRTSDPAHWITASAAGAGGSGAGIAGHEPATVFLPEADATVTVVPFEPWPDPSGIGWTAEIDLGAVTRTSYTPFVELALVRYQPVSVEGMHLSRVVRSDIVQLQPDRTVDIRRNGDIAVTTLSGIGSGIENIVDVWFERWNGPPGEKAPTPSPQFLSLDPPDGHDAVRTWVRIPDASASGALGEAIRLTVPSGAAETIRMVVREREDLRSPPPGFDPIAREVGFRTVFVDAVRIR